MIKKIISALCVLFLTFGFVSCNKSKVDQYMDINEEIADIMGEIHDTKSADKYADKLTKLLDESKPSND